ncbi:hypothetical protein [Thermostichus vulcanus]|uniref:Uncharacterized protein n=1 Tax=Thermostichus vulcanus str. 'Rupite' TaxID=2813851 RepID=A0ABT0CEE5_THEVL|nr:hypothetical protein [Thermostichus vulcanus]MCJ2544141.1 hypothetical protein [Thermostichus vulcanus str. 'Rupite']
MVGALSEKNETQKNTSTSLLVKLVEKALITSVSVLAGGFFLWTVGYPQVPIFILYLFFGLLFFDLMSWGIDRFSQCWRYRHLKSIASALTPLISIVAFWAVFCRCPIEVILSGDHWQVLALLLLYPTCKLLHVFWEIFRSKDSKIVEQP